MVEWYLIGFAVAHANEGIFCEADEPQTSFGCVVVGVTVGQEQKFGGAFGFRHGLLNPGPVWRSPNRASCYIQAQAGSR